MFYSKFIEGTGFVTGKDEVGYKLTDMNLCPRRTTMQLTFWKGEPGVEGSSCFQMVIGKRDWKKMVSNVKTVFNKEV